MQYTQFFAVNYSSGAVLPNATVTVYDNGTTTKPQLYDANGNAMLNPFNASGIGLVGFKVADGTYDIQIQSGSYTAPLIQQFQIVDLNALSEGAMKLPSDFGALGDGADFIDVSISASSNLATSASGAFAGAAIGQEIVIQGAGVGGAALSTTISNASGAPNSVVLTANASAAVTNASGFFGTDDTNALSQWCAGEGWRGADPSTIHVITAPISLPPVIAGRLRVRVTSSLGAGQVALSASGTAGAAQSLNSVLCGSTAFTPASQSGFRIGGFAHFVSNQIIGLETNSTLGEMGIVQAINGDGSINVIEPLRFGYTSRRVAYMAFKSPTANTPGSNYAFNDILTLSGGTLAPLSVTAVNTTSNTVTIAEGAPIYNILEFFTGSAWQFASTGTLPSGISPATNYYVGNVDINQGSFTCQLYGAQADAIAGNGTSLVTLTTPGSGTITATSAFQIRVTAVSTTGTTGAIIGWQPLSWGSYSALPALPASFTTNSVSGSGAQAQILTLENCTVTPVNPIEPDLDVEVMGDHSTDLSGFAVYYALGGRVRSAGAHCGSRVGEITASTDTSWEIANTHDVNGQTSSYGLSINGACKRVRVKGSGAMYLNRHATTTNNTSETVYAGIPIDTTVEGLHVGLSSPYPHTPAAVTNVDYTSGANLITVATVVSNGNGLLFSTTGTLPGGLPTGSIFVYAGNVSVMNGVTTFQPYQDYDDALRSTGTNVYTLTSAGTGTITAAIQQGGDAIDTHNAMLNTTYRDCIVESSSNQGINSDGGGCRVYRCTIRNTTKNGVGLFNSTFYPVTHAIDDLMVENAGSRGVEIAGGACVKDRLELGKINTRWSAAESVYFFTASPLYPLRIEHAGSISSRNDQATVPNTVAAVYLRNVEGPIPDVQITGIPPSAKGLRLSGYTNGKMGRARIVAGGAAARLIYADNATSHVVIDNADLDDGGYANVTGIDLSDSTVANVAVGPRNDFHNMSPNLGANATGNWLRLGASSAANNIDIRSEWFVPVTHAMSGYAAPNGRATLLCNSTGGAITINPPAYPALTDSITIADDAGAAQTYALTFGGTTGANDATTINRQGDVNRYAWSPSQTHWKQMQ